MIQQRIGVWETNSSSMHSLCIHRKSSHIDPTGLDSYIEDNTITIELGEFGWGYEKTNDAYIKASYLFTQNHCADGDNPTIKEDIINSIRRGSNVSNIILTNEEDCYIDHQSCDGVVEFLSRVPGADLEEKIFNFIYDTGIDLIIDNDNH